MIFSIIIFLFTLLVLVVIHEFGHFIMAKKFKIKVEEFGFGIPPKLIGKKIGETLYSLNLLPIGGFVRLLGEDDLPAGRQEVDKKVLENPRSFASQNVWKRILVVIAGVVMNLILAWVLFYTVIIAQNFRIISPTIEQGVYIGRLEKDLPAQKAGIKVGDRLLSVDGRKVTNLEEARNLIKQKGETAVTLNLLDDKDKERIVEVFPKKVEENTLIGVYFTPFFIKEYHSPTEKIFSGITYSYDLTKLTFIGLGRTISDMLNGNFGRASQQVSGPIGIAGMTNDILSNGWQAAIPYIWFVGVISLTLSIFNVLPIPALDGGRLFFLVIEGLFKKKVKVEIERVIHQVGFALLLVLAFLITYSDISKMVR